MSSINSAGTRYRFFFKKISFYHVLYTKINFEMKYDPNIKYKSSKRKHKREFCNHVLSNVFSEIQKINTKKNLINYIKSKF